MLSKKQLDIQKKIEQSFFPGNETFLHLHGPSGAGKTTILESYISKIQDEYQDWSIYYIKGDRHSVEPYSTITLSDSFKRPILEFTGVNVNAGFKISELFSLGIIGVFQKKPLVDPKFSFVIQDLSKDSSTNLLIVADSFQYWDTTSQDFLRTLKRSTKKLLPQKNLRILMVTDNERDSVSEYIDIKELNSSSAEILISLPTKEELKEYLRLMNLYNPNLTKADVDTIMSFTNGNLDFIKIFMEGFYYSKTGKLSNERDSFDIKKLLDYLLIDFGERKKDFSEVLQISSILNGHFTFEEVKYLCEGKKDIETLLYESCDRSILKEGFDFTFSNEFIKDIFYEKLDRNRTRYHLEYSKYLQLNFPEKYLTRALHLSLSDSNKCNKYANEIVGLYALAYFRSIETTVASTELEKIHELLKNIVDDCNSFEIRKQYENFLSLKNVYELYLQEEYEEANKELSTITGNGHLLLASETNRMRLVISLMLNLNTDNVKRYAEELSLALDSLKKHEKEQWCKSAFTLFSTYSNKLDNFEESAKIVKELRSFISENYNNPYFVYIGNVISRKACLFESEVLAEAFTQESVVYFENKRNYFQYYLSLCNHSGVQIVLGKYEPAILNLKKCIQLIRENNYLNFPSKEKIYNNLALACFLSNYRKLDVLNESVLNEAIEQFKEIATEFSRESNAIIFINLINLYAIKGDYDECYSLLDILNRTILLDNDDSFYKYHIANINLALSIMQQSWIKAEEYLNELVSCFPNFYKKNARKIKKRNEALSKLIQQRMCLNALELDNWVYSNVRPEDEACKFYCRLFLFSDLQFSSI
ncbi:ATP-binding protein [Paenibacillus polymyxa]|uniref:ATP-binding protein n=1 Tax=Paenibacillus TaxID=44249 RepID=UPI0020247F89|nr:ATP-binding protein [Paenibacillus polymyxa]MDY8048705.1 ATP-binding protein [Paenibacillus polymyxa]WGV33228.1 ATP-binding protein [Paenibacillus polymyxa]